MESLNQVISPPHFHIFIIAGLTIERDLCTENFPASFPSRHVKKGKKQNKKKPYKTTVALFVF